MPKRDMPDFLDQNRPDKVKEIYRALKRDHPEYSAQKKARIASSKGKTASIRDALPYAAIAGLTGASIPAALVIDSHMQRKKTKSKVKKAACPDHLKPKGKTALERFAESRGAKSRSDFRKKASVSITAAGGNPHVVNIAFNQELEKIAGLGMALSGVGKAIAGGFKNFRGGLALKSGEGAMGQLGLQMGVAGRNAAARMKQPLQTHLGVNTSKGLGQFNKDWWAKGITDAQRTNIKHLGMGAGLAGVAGTAGAVAGRASAPDPRMRVTIHNRRVR